MLSNETEVPPHDTYKYPYLMSQPLVQELQTESSPVVGEVYEIDRNTLQRLDELEGIEYERCDVNVTSTSNTLGTLSCQVYLLTHGPTMAKIETALRAAEDGPRRYAVVSPCDWKSFIGGY